MRAWKLDPSARVRGSSLVREVRVGHLRHHRLLHLAFAWRHLPSSSAVRAKWFSASMKLAIAHLGLAAFCSLVFQARLPRQPSAHPESLAGAGRAGREARKGLFDAFPQTRPYRAGWLHQRDSRPATRRWARPHRLAGLEQGSSRNRHRRQSTLPGFTSTMRFATLRMRWRSCVMSRMVPSKRLSACLPSSALAMSRWLVGSSRIAQRLGRTSIFIRQRQDGPSRRREHADLLLDGVALK